MKRFLAHWLTVTIALGGNGLAFYLAAMVVPGFHVRSFLSAVVGSLVVGLVSWFVGMFGRSDPAVVSR